MKKNKSKLVYLATAICIANVGFSQIYTPSGIVNGTSTSSTNVGIGTNAPKKMLDVRGPSTFGGGLDYSDFNWATLPAERTMMLTGTTGGYGSMCLGRNDVEAPGQTLGYLLFGQKVAPTETTDAGLKAAIGAVSSGNGGITGGYGGNLIFSTTSDNTYNIIPERMRLDLNGNLGIGTPSPLEQLHTTAGVIFAGLTIGGTPNNNVVIDANGKLWRAPLATPGITNACGTVNYIPKTNTTTGNLTCSQIFDDGTSVGLGINSGFAYTWSGGLTGSTAPAASGTVKLYVNGVTKALAYFATSDQRFKKEITSINGALDIIKKLDGKTYFWRTDEFKERNFNSSKQYGFIAQELEKIIPEVVATDESGYKSVNYDMVIPIVVQATKEQSIVIENQQKQIDELKQLITAITANANTPAANRIAINLNDKDAVVLNQNQPNPFAEQTIISYNIPQDASAAQLLFYDAMGRQIKTVNITTKGAGQLNVFSDDLTNGIYSYTLIIDGKIIDTKKMVKQQ